MEINGLTLSEAINVIAKLKEERRFLKRRVAQYKGTIVSLRKDTELLDAVEGFESISIVHEDGAWEVGSGDTVSISVDLRDALRMIGGAR